MASIRAADASAKILVFSHFQPVLDMLRRFLEQEAYHCRELAGSMGREARAKALKLFRSDDRAILLVSIRVGAVRG